MAKKTTEITVDIEKELEVSKIIDNGNAPTFQIDNMGGIMANMSPFGGSVRFNLLQDFPHQQPLANHNEFEPRSIVAARIFMTPEAFIKMAKIFNSIAEGLESEIESEQE